MRIRDILEMYIEPALSRDTINDGWNWARECREGFGTIGEVSVLEKRDGKHWYFKLVLERRMIGFADLID